MNTDKDWNTHAELHHDLSHWNDLEKDLEEDRKERFNKLWSGEGFMYYGRHITLDMVFEDILNDRPDTDIDEVVLKYAMDYPESEWYTIIEDYVKHFVEHFEEA